MSAVNTERAEQSVAEAVQKIPGLALDYAGKWDTLFTPFVQHFVNACEALEREVSREIDPLYARLKEVFHNFEAGVRTRFDKKCEDALATLKTDIRNGYLSLRKKNKELKVQVAEAEKTLPDLEKNVRKQKVAMAGHEGDIEIPPAEKDARETRAFWGRSAVLVFAAALEYWAGFPTWVDMSSPNAAIWLSTLFIGGTVFGSWVGVHYKRYQVRRDAELNFNENFPTGHPEGFKPDPIPTAEKAAALGGMWIIGVMLAAFVGSRIWVVLEGRDSFYFYASSVALLVIFAAAPVVSILLTRPYSKREYDVLREAEEKLQEAKANVVVLKSQLEGSKKAFRASSNSAYKEYETTIAQARDSALDEIKAMNKERLRLVELLHNLETNLWVVVSSFPESCNTLVATVIDELGLSDTHAPFRDPQYEAEVKGRLNGHRVHRWHKPGFTLRDFQAKEFVVNIPTDGLADQKSVEDEVFATLHQWTMGSSERVIGVLEESIRVDETNVGETGSGEVSHDRV